MRPSGKSVSRTAATSSAAEHVAAVAAELALERVGDALLDDRARLVRAQDRVVEALESTRRRRRPARSAVASTSAGTLPGPTPMRRVAGAVRRPHDADAARGDDHVGGRVAHQRLDQRDRRLLDHLQAAVRRAGRDRGVGQEAGRVGRHLAGQRVRADDHRVARHQREQHLEVDGRDRVGRRRQREDDAGRPGQLDDLGLGVDAGAHVVVVAVPLEQPREHASFLRRLCSATPMPVSCTAQSAYLSAFRYAASATASTIRRVRSAS